MIGFFQIKSPIKVAEFFERNTIVRERTYAPGIRKRISERQRTSFFETSRERLEAEGEMSKFK